MGLAVGTRQGRADDQKDDSETGYRGHLVNRLRPLGPWCAVGQGYLSVSHFLHCRNMFEAGAFDRNS